MISFDLRGLLSFDSLSATYAENYVNGLKISFLPGDKVLGGLSLPSTPGIADPRDRRRQIRRIQLGTR